MGNLSSWQDGVRSLIRDEQRRQAGQLLPVANVEGYIDRILTHADFSCHHTAEQCLGFVAYYCLDESTPDAFITLFIVAPEARGSGLAASLLDGVIARSRQHDCSRLTLWVHKKNACAIRFYHRQGFRSCAVREHEVLMALPISCSKGSVLSLSNQME